MRDEGLRLFDEGHIRAAAAYNDLGFNLGLVTPNADTCKIFIDGEPYNWKDGKDVLFDETFIHYAENKSEVTRLILFCDVERPMTNGLMARLNHWIFLS